MSKKRDEEWNTALTSNPDCSVQVAICTRRFGDAKTAFAPAPPPPPTSNLLKVTAMSAKGAKSRKNCCKKLLDTGHARTSIQKTAARTDLNSRTSVLDLQYQVKNSR